MTRKQKILSLRHDIVTLRKENPAMTLKQISIIVNRTVERVRQILVSEGIETRSAKRIASDSKPYLICRLCDAPITQIRKGRVYKGSLKYCRGCITNKAWLVDLGLRRRKVPRIDIPCDYCKTLVNMRETLYKRQQTLHKNFYCSKHCRAKSLWANQIVINVHGRIRKR